MGTITAFEQITVAEQGDPGPLFYPAGIWSQQGKYSRTKDACPFVLYDTGNPSTSFYYFLTKEGTYSYDKDKDKADFGNPPESAGVNGIWRQLTNHQHVFTQFLMANHALLAGAVAYNNQMFSQLGTINGTASSAYTSTNFIPNLLLDWAKGVLKCNNAEIRGHVEATSGSFTGEINAHSGSFSGYIKTPFSMISESDAVFSGGKYLLKKDLNLECGVCTVVFPNDSSYIGIHVKLYNYHYIYTLNGYTTKVESEGGGYLYGTLTNSDIIDRKSHPTSISFASYMVEFIAIPPVLTGRKCDWLVIN
ncbi:MAG: hypothetical protein LIP01_08720, partial [Tannerellaceae bacterium]|nr:hypothetical protein [Tannerellaceae bacterium]